MRLDIIEVTATAMTTWLRVREQIHSNLIGLHVSAGDSEVGQTLARLLGRFAGHGASHGVAAARAAGTLASFVRREANVLSVIDGFTVAFCAAIVGLLLISLMCPAPAGPLVPKSANAS